MPNCPCIYHFLPPFLPIFWFALPIILTSLHQCLILSTFVQILMIRVIYEKVGGMLSSHERAELRVAEAFSSFSNINPLHYNPYTQPLWRAAVTQYDRMMAPAEQKVAGKLRNEIRGLESNSKQLIRKLETLGDLIRRPSISKELVMERWD